MKNGIKLLIVITLFLFSMQASLYAQTNSTLDYVVLNHGDTIYGAVKHIDEKAVHPKYYKKIRVLDVYGKQKKYKRKDVSTFRADNTIYEGFWLNQSSQKPVLLNPRYDIDPQKGERVFLKVISKGNLSHYELEWWNQGESDLMQMDLLRKEGDYFFIRATQGLFGLKRKVLANYFVKCPSLKEGIEQKRLNEVGQVVDFYNYNCSD